MRIYPNGGGTHPTTSTTVRTVSGNPFGGFTLVGGVLVFILLIAFIRNKAVTIFLGVLLVAHLLINSKIIIPKLFNSNIASSSLKNVGF